MPRIASCVRCTLHKTANHVCVWGTGTDHTKIMLIAEAPGENEDIQGVPFVGKAGLELDKLLAAAGLRRSDVYITNVSKCWPKAADGSTRAPTDAEMQACFPYFAEEIAMIKPKVIVALGASALKALTGKKEVGANRGKVLPARAGVRVADAQIIGTYHPAAFLHSHNPQIPDHIVRDLKLAATLAGVSAVAGQASSAALPYKRALLGPQRAPGALARALGILATRAADGRVAVDCEWTGERTTGKVDIKWPWRKGAELYSLAMTVKGTDGTLYSVGVATPFDDDELGALCEFFLTRLAIFHNAMADLQWLNGVDGTGLGLPIKLAGDSMVLSFLLDGDEAHDLESLYVGHCGGKPWKSDLWPKRPRATDSAAWEALLGYNVTDTEHTLVLEEQLRSELKARSVEERAGITKLYTKLLLPAIPVFAQMAIDGAPLDHDLLDAAIVKAVGDTNVAAKELADLIGCSSARAEEIAQSSTQFMQYLRRQGITVTSTNAKVLLDVDHDSVKPAQGVRKQRKLRGTYLEPWAQMIAEQRDAEWDRGDRLHTVYRITVARTGRTSAEVSKGASIQLVKRGEELRPIIQAKPGRSVICLDYAGVELRLIASMAPERTMLKLFAENTDLHLRTAMEINRDEVIRTATMWLVLCGLPTNGTGAQVLSGVWRSLINRAEGSSEAKSELRALEESLKDGRGCQDWGGEWWKSSRGTQSFMEGRLHLLSSIQERCVRAMRNSIEASRRSSQGREQQELGGEQLRDALSKLSSARALQSEEREGVRTEPNMRTLRQGEVPNQEGVSYTDAVRLLSCVGASLQRIDPVWKDYRQGAKGLAFGYAYGMQPPHFIEYAKTTFGLTFTLEDATESRAAFFRAYPDLDDWHNRAAVAAQRGQIIITPLGYVRRGVTEMTKHLNTDIQTTASYITVLTMVAIARAIERGDMPPAQLISFVHDSIALETDDCYRDEVKEQAVWIMEHPELEQFGFELKVPLIAEVKMPIGRAWG